MYVEVKAAVCLSECLSETECGGGARGWQILMKLVITQILYIHESADKKKKKNIPLESITK